MRVEKLQAQQEDLADVQSTIATNLRSIRFTAALLPLLQKQPPLKKFIAEVMEILKTQPAAAEICVESGMPLRFAAESGRYGAVFQGLNEAMGNTSD
jgi:short-subunit dehydrogenase involved in D-alanine esterification of teichoic acids